MPPRPRMLAAAIAAVLALGAQAVPAAAADGPAGDWRPPRPAASRSPLSTPRRPNSPAPTAR
ncbi:hypothetical protein STENM36S_07959 [Streptomyces tendae]